ncbi:receptor protein-tyrosine kinase CEPR1-like [Impatiens glandulifera]|uniref:receptor protein-tyrosine kinase CEPR1-like n=1 Tax=Impatiens glandulifera TaxID=253017 RepID=UPI001FB19BE0|nr:receptor protein-tyrosine kinase CEPR1-like [Impatiens glandulifera]
MAHHHRLIFFILVLLLNSSQVISTNNQSVFLTLMKTTLTGGQCFSNWELGKPFCNFTGISCDNRSNVIMIDVDGCSLSGRFPDYVCSYLPTLKILRLGKNVIHGGFPKGITNCSVLEELNMNHLNLTGTLPDFSQMKSLKFLDMSYNSFSGDFPLSIAMLTNLEEVNFNENENFNLWELPESFSNMTKLNTIVLTTCMLRGTIPSWIGNMTSLIDLELSGNYLVRRIPAEIGSLKNLKQLELYYNQLEGPIPEEIGNLTNLIDLDMSVNKLTGGIPESISRLPNLTVLQLYNNSLTGEIPVGFGNSTNLTMLSVYDNFLTGEVPPSLGSIAPMILLDLSENQFTGSLPPRLCDRGQLMYFLMLQNMFSGQIPESYSRCNSLLRFRVRYNRLEGPIPNGLLGLPNVSIIDLGYNRLNGTISNKIGGAKNLSELFLENNMIAGALPFEISQAGNLVKIDLSNNRLSGSIPIEIGNLRKLNSLMLQGNVLTSTIPVSLSSLKSLNILDLSNNNLTGRIPQELIELLPNSINFSHNLLSGPIPLAFVENGLVESFSDNPGLCIPSFVTATLQNFPICPHTITRKQINSIGVIVIPIILLIVIGIVFLLCRWLKKEQATINSDDTSFYSYEVKSFHRITFDHREIIESMVEKNIVGEGGSGTVYKIELTNGESVAVKRLRSRKTVEDRIFFDKELKTEVDTLGNIRHKNIVKLYCCFSNQESRLLVYEYMPKGNLWEALHREKTNLDWTARHRIAIGIAQGLAYLHHDLSPPIIHRDIKTTNILLDGNYHPKVADFGIAKVLQAKGKDSTTTVIAGTYGYLAPEYAYSSKATTKCDVYSYGVVLMELITGKRPVEKEFGENKNIVYWVSTKVETKEGAMEILDKRLSDFYKDEMIKALRVSIRCTCNVPALRPTMNEVVQLLSEAEPCKCDPNKFSLEGIMKNSIYDS